MIRMDYVFSKLNKLTKAPAKAGHHYSISQEYCEELGLKNVALRSHQLEGLKWLSECHERGQHGCILGDEMGLGKTLQSIALLLYLRDASSSPSPPFIVICPLSVVSGWEKELQRASPQLRVLNFCGDKEARGSKQEEILLHCYKSGAMIDPPFDILLVHYEIVLKDTNFLQKFSWGCVVVDEAHRLKNPNSLLYQALRQFKSQFCLLLTGTPVQNNLSELYSLLSFVAPDIFKIDNLEVFVDHFKSLQDDKESVATLHSLLDPFLLRRTKSEVSLGLPLKSEIVLYTGLSNIQKTVYKAILTKDLTAFGDASTKTRLMNILSQLRKCINHPYLFDGIEPEPFELGEHLIEASGKLFLIDKLLQYLKLHGHRVLMFSQMTRMLDILQDYLGYRGYSYERLDGSVRGEERFLAVQNFSNNEDTFIFLLSTRAGGQGLNLVSADTVIFVDSDFNPQNDLQAAARAHRMGQTKPVKVLRLVTRDTAEEIVLRRAEAKLSLTQTVIEGGQFSHGTVGMVADNATQLADILKFGLDKLMESAESSLGCEDLESIIGETDANGHWIIQDTAITEAIEEGQGEEGEEKRGPETIYIYEGRDYSKVDEKDQKTFEELLSEQLILSSTGSATDERVLRSGGSGGGQLRATDDLLFQKRKRKPLTEEQLEERRKKREEAKIKRQKLMEEEKKRQIEEKERKKQEWWEEHNYSSLKIKEEEEEEEEDEREEREIQYLIGDVTQPQNTSTNDAIIVHCVDDSGRWGRGGLFSGISTRSMQPETYYKKASKMRDLSLSDVHVIPVDDIMSRDQGRDMLALIVAQSRDSSGSLSGIKLPSLSVGLQRISSLALRLNASVHLPRIGHSTPHFNWYGTERLIRKYLSNKGIPTFMYLRNAQATYDNYYFPHHGQLKAVPRVSPELHTKDVHKYQWLPVGVDPLPDIFNDVSVCFYGIDESTRHTLSRYIIAYNGDVQETPTDKTTHIIVPGLKGNKFPWNTHKATVVSLKWLEDSLHEGHLLQTEKYLIHHLV